MSIAIIVNDSNAAFDSDSDADNDDDKKPITRPTKPEPMMITPKMRKKGRDITPRR